VSGFAPDAFQGLTGTPGQPIAPPRPERIPWLLVLLHLAIGGVALALAVSEEFAAGKAVFASDTWKALLGATGAGIAFTGIRGMFRNLNQSIPSVTEERRRRARIGGRFLILVGAGFVTASTSDAVAARSVAFDSWVDAFFLAGGIYLLILGLLLQLNPAGTLAQQRLAQGDGMPGRATILRTEDLATSEDGSGFVQIEVEIEAGGRTTTASETTMLDAAKRALLIPGATVEVLVDRMKPDVFEVDWDSWQGPAQ
jgi:hypothetical protein